MKSWLLVRQSRHYLVWSERVEGPLQRQRAGVFAAKSGSFIQVARVRGLISALVVTLGGLASDALLLGGA